jgi:hypothetical protein
MPGNMSGVGRPWFVQWCSETSHRPIRRVVGSGITRDGREMRRRGTRFELVRFRDPSWLGVGRRLVPCGFVSLPAATMESSCSTFGKGRQELPPGMWGRQFIQSTVRISREGARGFTWNQYQASQAGARSSGKSRLGRRVTSRSSSPINTVSFSPEHNLHNANSDERRYPNRFRRCAICH